MCLEVVCLTCSYLPSLMSFTRQCLYSTKANQGHVLSAGFGILLLSTIAFSLYAHSYIPSILWIGAYSLCTLFIYIIAMRLIFYYEKRQMSKYLEEIATETKYEDISTKNAVLHYTINAFFVIIAAAFLPKIGAGIAEITGLGQTFVGNIFIAISTSLPEVAEKKPFYFMAWDSLGIVSVYIVNLIILYRMR